MRPLLKNHREDAGGLSVRSRSVTESMRAPIVVWKRPAPAFRAVLEQSHSQRAAVRGALLLATLAALLAPQNTCSEARTNLLDPQAFVSRSPSLRLGAGIARSSGTVLAPPGRGAPHSVAASRGRDEEDRGWGRGCSAAPGRSRHTEQRNGPSVPRHSRPGGPERNRSKRFQKGKRV